MAAPNAAGDASIQRHGVPATKSTWVRALAWASSDALAPAASTRTLRGARAAAPASPATSSAGGASAAAGPTAIVAPRSVRTNPASATDAAHHRQVPVAVGARSL